VGNSSRRALEHLHATAEEEVPGRNNQPAESHCDRTGYRAYDECDKNQDSMFGDFKFFAGLVKKVIQMIKYL
jgi:hypothetical protein